MANGTGGRNYDFYSNIKPKKVDWLWYPYIPYGKLTVLQGDPGEGKSTVLLNLAAILSVGGQLPTGEQLKEPISVIYQCAEDSPSDTIKPRLVAAGADCSKIAYILDSDASLTLEDSRIRETIEQTGARMLIIDPIQAYIPQDIDMQRATKMRGTLRKLAAVAEDENCAIVLVGHMSKGTGAKNLYRGLGSIDIMAIARSVLMVSRDAEDSYTRYLFAVKSSLAPEGEAIGFKIGTSQGFQWLGRCNFDNSQFEDVVDSPRRKKECAKKYLAELLADGDMSSAQILSKLSKLGVSERTAKRARREMAIRVYRLAGSWFWHLDHLTDQEGEPDEL